MAKQRKPSRLENVEAVRFVMNDDAFTAKLGAPAKKTGAKVAGPKTLPRRRKKS